MLELGGTSGGTMEMSNSLEKIKHELSPYILPQKYVDEGSNETIGSGSYGTITKIKYCGTPCAAKELHSIFLPDDESVLSHNGNEAVNQFCREIKILSQIQHPNFVRFIGIYFKGSSTYPLLVMELMYKSLDQCLVRYRRDSPESQKLPVSTKLFILQDVARAMAYIHCQCPPIVHHDLTVKNVLLTFSMTAKVADLGVAKYLMKPLSTQCPGTVVYMPPEALIKHPHYGTEVDVYSYGVLGFHVFSGKWPLQHGLHKENGKAFTDLERCHVDEIGEGFCVRETLKKCLHVDPKQRLKACEILAKIDVEADRYKIENDNFLEIQYNARNTRVMQQTMDQMAKDLVLKEKFIKRLQMEKIETSSNKDLKETIKLLEDGKTELALEVAKLHSVIKHQLDESQKLSSGTQKVKYASISQPLIDAECEANLRCLVLKKEKETLSDTIKKLNARVSTLSVEVESKDKQLHAKNNEFEEISTQWINTVRTLKRKAVEREDKIRAVRDQYNKLLQDLLIPRVVSILDVLRVILHVMSIFIGNILL